MNPIDIRKALLDAQKTQAEIGRELGIGRAYVNQVIQGTYGSKGKRSDRVREAIARAIGKRPSQIWVN